MSLRNGMRALVAAVLCLVGAAAVHAEGEIVIVANKALPVQSIDARAIKLAYFGIPQSREGVELQPVINTTDAELTRRFLEKALGTRPDEYTENLRHRQFAQGGKALREVGDAGELLRVLSRMPGAITYMTAEQASVLADVKVLATLH